MKKFVSLGWFLLLLPVYSQKPTGEGSGGHVESLQRHTLRLQRQPEESFPLCGKKLIEILPQKVFGNWIQIEYEVADGIDTGEILPYLAKIVSRLLDKNNDLSFLSYGKMKSEAIDQALTINSRIIIRFHRDRSHPLLGAEYVVLNVDTERKIAHFKWDERDGVLRVDQ